MELKNYIVHSTQTYLNQGHIEAGSLPRLIEQHDGREAYHALFDMEPRDDFKAFNGLHFPTMGWVIIDIDTEVKDENNKPLIKETTSKAKQVTEKVIHDLKLEESFARVFFSGSKGFHIYIRAEYFGITEPSVDCSKTLKAIIVKLAEKFGFVFDRSVYHANRKIRMPSSLNPKSNLYKTELDFKTFKNTTVEEILKRAERPSLNDLDYYEKPTIRYSDIIGTQIISDTGTGYFGGEILDSSASDKFKKFPKKVCIQRMESTPIDKDETKTTRHEVMLALIADFVNTGVKREEAEERIEKFLTLNGISERFQVQGLHAIREAYTKGIKYYETCYTEVRKAFCSGTCDLYRKLDKTKRAVVTDAPPENVVVNAEPRKDDDIFYLPNGTSLKHSDLAVALAESCKNKIIFDISRDKFYVFQKVWAQTTEAEIKKAVLQTLIKATERTGFNGTVFTTTFNLLKIILGKSKIEWDTTTYLPLQNGLLNLNTKTLEPFSHDKLVNFILPYSYDETATCPNFDHLIDFLSQGKESNKKVLMCYLAAVVRGFYRLEKYLELVGEAGSGKSSYISVAEALVGQENHISSNLRNLANRFETSSFYGKRLLSFPDEKSHLAEGTDVFKSLTGGDAIRFEEKGKQMGESFIFTGMVIVGANSPLSFEDYSNAIPRRRITVHIDAQLNDIRRKDNFKDLLKNEIPGVLNKLLEISPDAIKGVLTNRFGDLNESKIRSLTETNHVADWIDNSLILDKNNYVYVGSNRGDSPDGPRDDEMYPHYVSWCYGNGIKIPLSGKKFSETIKTIFTQHNIPIIKSEKKTKRGYKYSGARIRKESSIIDDTVPSLLHNSRVDE